MSGFAAAVTAARTGVKTVLAEKNHFPGSVNTSGMMSSIGNYFLTRDGTQITYGLPIEFIDRIVSEGGGEKDYLRKELPQIPADPEITKRVMTPISWIPQAKSATAYREEPSARRCIPAASSWMAYLRMIASASWAKWTEGPSPLGSCAKRGSFRCRC
jgi:hypothetical protein